MWGSLVAVCLLLADSTLGDHRGRYTREVRDFEIVVPRKVSVEGKFISYYLPQFYNVGRVRRGADTGRVQYALPVQGREVVVELSPTEDFHAPGLVIEHHQADAKMNVSSIKLSRPWVGRCHYGGKVRGEPESSVAISACSGLAGSIRIGTEQYLIEPVDDDGKPTIGLEHSHLLYKRSHQKSFGNGTTCGTTGKFDTEFHRRMKWEAEFGKQIEQSMKGNEGDYFTQPAEQQNDFQRPERNCPPESKKNQSPLFIELLLVIGLQAAKKTYLNDDLEQYINTVLNIAVMNFHDSSLGQPILVKLVRVITLGFDYEELDIARYGPQQILKNFCEWQMNFNPRMERHPNHHDFAIYLVKFESCQATLGLSNMASMCRPDQACAIVKEDGLLTGNILTHMLGHSLGADHDDSSVNSCCSTEPDGTTYHMGPNICSHSSAWSKCSRQQIQQFLKTHAGWCLTDIPATLDLTSPMILPGQVYSAADQCRLSFEIETHACLIGDFCRQLYCEIGDKQCVSSGEPPAQGTNCGPGLWCFNRLCVRRGSRPGVVNGEWGEWSRWSPCTKTCGGGVQTARRACDSPAPANGGRVCPGHWLKSRMCNVGGCLDNGIGFLDQQCISTNGVPYRGRKHFWSFYNHQIEDLHCTVICVNEMDEVAIRSPLARDGTYCKAGHRDVCIRGICQPVGCDWVIGSKAKEDACGVCHGNGTECRVVQGSFRDQNFRGFVEFLTVPMGTRMVLLRETRPSPCFFVIANSMNSSYYLNNDHHETLVFAGKFNIQGTVGIYQTKADMERVFIKGPVSVPITIGFSCRDLEKSLGVLYQYALPERDASYVPKYTWEYVAWEKCTFPCGGGVQQAVPICVEEVGGEVEDCFCSLHAKPLNKVRVCNRKPCRAKWWVGPWSVCECFNREGVKTRMVMCAYLKEVRSSYIVILAEDQCAGLAKPSTAQPCDPVKYREEWIRRRERGKRDLTELVPHSEASDDYSVYSNATEKTNAINVRNLFDGVDPDELQDYAYLKRIGMTNSLWEKIFGSEEANRGQRIRRRQPRARPMGWISIATASPSWKYKGKATSVKNADNSELAVATKEKASVESATVKGQIVTDGRGEELQELHRKGISESASKSTKQTLTKTDVSSDNVSGAQQLHPVQHKDQPRKQKIAGPGSIFGHRRRFSTRAPTAVSVLQKSCTDCQATCPPTPKKCETTTCHQPIPCQSKIDCLDPNHVKIYFVPIKTTIRTILQSDEEFVIMDTMAKYPVADELEAIQLSGKAAKKALKSARARHNISANKTFVQD